MEKLSSTFGSSERKNSALPYAGAAAAAAMAILNAGCGNPQCENSTRIYAPVTVIDESDCVPERDGDSSYDEDNNSHFTPGENGVASFVRIDVGGPAPRGYFMSSDREGPYDGGDIILKARDYAYGKGMVGLCQAGQDWGSWQTDGRTLNLLADTYRFPESKEGCIAALSVLPDELPKVLNNQTDSFAWVGAGNQVDNHPGLRSMSIQVAYSE
jgi:hypothetical protein